MKLEHQELLREFYKTISPHFPGLTITDLNQIVSGPFNHLKKMIENEEINYMRLKYFGSFVVHKRKAVSELNNLDKRLEQGIISQEQYDKYKKMLHNYLKDYGREDS